MNSALRRGSILLVVCLLFGAAAPVGGEVTQQRTDNQVTVTPNTNGTNYLSPVDPATEGYERISVDVSSAASFSAQTIQSEHDSRSWGEQLANANRTNRERIANAQLDAVETRFEQIAQRQQELYEAYAAGEITERVLLRDLVTLQIIAESQIENYDRATGRTELDIERLSQLETLADGVTPEQPVVDLAAETMVSGDDERIVYLQGADEGVAISTVTERQFTRQATVLSERDFDGQDQFKLAQNISIGDDDWATPRGYSEAQTRLAELYPWAYSIRQIEPGAVNPLSRIYSFNMPNLQGDLTTYFDGATRNVFHENQAGNVEAYSIDGVVSNGTDSLTVTLGLTHNSGPLRVTVEDGDRPVPDATVRVDGQPVGATDADGKLWTIQPLSGFEVTATTPDGETAAVSFP
ncbi:MAG: hypothetical protein ACI8TL_001716 [Natronomonas sp.]|jgi:hypothetical protein